jgi:hypothetical protein
MIMNYTPMATFAQMRPPLHSRSGCAYPNTTTGGNILSYKHNIVWCLNHWGDEVGSELPPPEVVASKTESTINHTLRYTLHVASHHSGYASESVRGCCPKTEMHLKPTDAGSKPAMTDSGPLISSVAQLEGFVN